MTDRGANGLNVVPKVYEVYREQFGGSSKIFLHFYFHLSHLSQSFGNCSLRINYFFTKGLMLVFLNHILIIKYIVGIRYTY